MKSKLMMVVLLIGFWCLAETGVLAYPIPDTGVTTCYDHTNLEMIPCPQEGEPFYGQDGNYDINPPSYTKLDENGGELADDATSWAMVRDNVTGLIWELKTGGLGGRYFADTYNWYDAQDFFIAQLNASGFGGKRDAHANLRFFFSAVI